MAVNLTTRYLFKLHAGISVTTYDTLIDTLIDDVSELIEQACDRTFTATTYRAWLDGSGARTMMLPEWPVTNLYRVCIGSDNVLEVEYTSSGLHADISFDGTTFTLHYITSAGTETTNTTITAADNAQISDLENALEAISGWSATVRGGNSTQPTTLIKPFRARWCLNPDSMTMEVPDTGDGLDVELVSETNRAIATTYGRSFPKGRSNIFVWYKAGYTLPVGTTSVTTEGTVPKGLTLVANQIINDVYMSRKDDLTLKSKKLGDYSWTRGDVKDFQGYIEAHWNDLRRYARHDLVEA